MTRGNASFHATKYRQILCIFYLYRNWNAKTGWYNGNNILLYIRLEWEQINWNLKILCSLTNYKWLLLCQILNNGYYIMSDSTYALLLRFHTLITWYHKLQINLFIDSSVSYTDNMVSYMYIVRMNTYLQLK
jgi:hypothetical protein